MLGLPRDPATGSDALFENGRQDKTTRSHSTEAKTETHTQPDETQGWGHMDTDVSLLRIEEVFMHYVSTDRDVDLY